MTATGPALAATRPSLRSRLLRHVMPPLLLTWAIGSLATLSIASFFTLRAYDRALLDDALVLASHVVLRDGEPALDINDVDLRTVLYDQSESVYFAVRRPDGRLVAGHPGLRPPPARRPEAPGDPQDDGEGDNTVQFSDWHHQGREVRAVLLQRSTPAPMQVIVALTTRSRESLQHRLALYSLLPQVLLLAALALWLYRVMRIDLAPLARLQQVVERRDAADLSPLPSMLIEQAASRDVQGLTQSIDALLARLAHGVAAQREFAGNVAHELKTPLAGVRAAAEYGLAQSDPRRWREQLGEVLKSQQRASHLIDQLLALALASEADTAITLTPLRLDVCVRDVLVQHLPQVDQAGFELGASGLDDAVTVLADRALVEGLLGNLLDNALRYGRDADGRGTLSVDLERHDNAVCLSVTDQGPGIPADQREALTHRWQQGAGAHRLGEGAGLGLSIVRRYAALMQARLQLSDGAQGVGLRVSVTFPARRTETG